MQKGLPETHQGQNNSSVTHRLRMSEFRALQGSTLNTCIVGCNSYIGKGSDLSDSIIMGNNAYTNEASRAASRKKGEAVLGIGEPLSHCFCVSYTGVYGLGRV